jgi:hypothetical protein
MERAATDPPTGRVNDSDPGTCAAHQQAFVFGSCRRSARCRRDSGRPTTPSEAVNIASTSSEWPVISMVSVMPVSGTCPRLGSLMAASGARPGPDRTTNNFPVANSSVAGVRAAIRVRFAWGQASNIPDLLSAVPSARCARGHLNRWRNRGQREYEVAVDGQLDLDPAACAVARRHDPQRVRIR